MDAIATLFQIDDAVIDARAAQHLPDHEQMQQVAAARMKSALQATAPFAPAPPAPPAPASLTRYLLAFCSVLPLHSNSRMFAFSKYRIVHQFHVLFCMMIILYIFWFLYCNCETADIAQMLTIKYQKPPCVFSAQTLQFVSIFCWFRFSCSMSALICVCFDA